MTGNQFVDPGEDVVEPLMMVFGAVSFGILADFFYTFGWISELLWCWGDTRRTEVMRQKVFRTGVVFSGVVTLLPAILIPAAWIIFGFQHAPSPLAIADRSALEALNIDNAPSDARKAVAIKDYRLLGVRGFTIEVPGAGNDFLLTSGKNGIKIIEGTSDAYQGGGGP